MLHSPLPTAPLLLYLSCIACAAATAIAGRTAAITAATAATIASVYKNSHVAHTSFAAWRWAATWVIVVLQNRTGLAHIQGVVLQGVEALAAVVI